MQVVSQSSRRTWDLHLLCCAAAVAQLTFLDDFFTRLQACFEIIG